ncbi:cell wall protein RBR3 [Cocos nucifera]|uniref:Cell wall protein RBR3 n=1 Tax=Cocos nucifera TaxID=13894 RepID=A0A8K0I6N7_COCNU|nr:cell wall protein RBR3 [Cocos nucifera]
MLSKTSDLPQESLQIRQDDKFYTRLLSKESSLANPSFRVYYGVATGSVPFLWETRPGTPKNTITTTTLPPLTPPPSYYSSPRIKSSKKSPKSNLIHTILPRLTLMRKAHAPPSPSVSLSSSSVSSSSSSFSPTGFTGTHHQRRRSASTRFSFSSGADDEDSVDDGSPTSTLCFGMRHAATGRLRGCHSVVTMKKALLSIVGHGSSQGTAA